MPENRRYGSRRLAITEREYRGRNPLYDSEYQWQTSTYFDELKGPMNPAEVEMLRDAYIKMKTVAATTESEKNKMPEIETVVDDVFLFLVENTKSEVNFRAADFTGKNKAVLKRRTPFNSMRHDPVTVRFDKIDFAGIESLECDPHLTLRFMGCKNIPKNISGVGCRMFLEACVGEEFSSNWQATEIVFSGAAPKIMDIDTLQASLSISNVEGLSNLIIDNANGKNVSLIYCNGLETIVVAEARTLTISQCTSRKGTNITTRNVRSHSFSRTGFGNCYFETPGSGGVKFSNVRFNANSTVSISSKHNIGSFRAESCSGSFSVNIDAPCETVDVVETPGIISVLIRNAIRVNAYNCRDLHTVVARGKVNEVVLDHLASLTTFDGQQVESLSMMYLPSFKKLTPELDIRHLYIDGRIVFPSYTYKNVKLLKAGKSFFIQYRNGSECFRPDRFTHEEYMYQGRKRRKFQMFLEAHMGK